MRPTIGISACLAGQNLRFNGSCMRHEWIEEVLSAGVSLRPVCPETAMGLGVPRTPLRLVRRDGEVRLEQIGTETDLTGQARSASQGIIASLPDLDGFVLAAKSPNCGVDRVKVYSDGIPFNDGTGVYAAMLQEARPDLLVIDSGRLHNAELREHFLKSVWVMYRFRITPQRRTALQNFHRRHKFSLMAHHPDKMTALGRLAADGTRLVQESFSAYRSGLAEILRIAPSRGNISNALVHMYGFLKGQLTPSEKTLFLEMLRKFRKGQIPALVPLHILSLARARHGQSYLEEQQAWQPVPEVELHHVI